MQTQVHFSNELQLVFHLYYYVKLLYLLFNIWGQVFRYKHVEVYELTLCLCKLFVTASLKKIHWNLLKLEWLKQKCLVHTVKQLKLDCELIYHVFFNKKRTNVSVFKVYFFSFHCFRVVSFRLHAIFFLFQLYKILRWKKIVNKSKNNFLVFQSILWNFLFKA